MLSCSVCDDFSFYMHSYYVIFFCVCHRICILFLTKTIFLCDRRPKDRSQLLGVSRENQLTAPGMIRVQEVRNGDDAFRFGRMAGFVNENVREVIARKNGRH